MSKPVNVLYKYVDGAHFFVSNDEASIGLCVAHNDVKAAYGAVAPQLKKLFKVNHGEDVEFHPAMSVDAFVGWLEAQKSQSLTRPSPGVAGVIGWGSSCDLEGNTLAA
jgi:hypothetical protein